MIYKNYILILILFFSLGKESFSQLTSFNWSETVSKKEDDIYKIITLKEHSMVVFNPKGSSIRFDVFSNSKYSVENIDFRGEFLDVLKVDNSVIIFSTIYNSTSKKDELLAKIIREGNVKESIVLEQTLENNLHYQFQVSVSPDNQKVLVLREDPYKKGKKESVIITVLNKKLEKEKEKDYLMGAIYSQRRKINVPIINNQGDVYVLKRYREDNSESKYYILSYGSNVSFDELKLNYKPIQDVQFTLNENGELIVGGTYSSPNSYRSEGVFIAKFNANGEKIYRKEYGFRPETMLEFTSERQLKKEGLGLFDFRTNQIIEQKENITLILEHRSIEANSKTEINTEKRDGLIVYSFDLNGDFKWDVPLTMNQIDVSEKGYWNSYISFNDTSKNNLSIVYNEVGYFDKNADNEFGEHTAVGARIITINNQGYYTKSPIKNSFKGAPIDLVLSPRTYKQIGSEMLIIAEPLDKSVYLLGVIK